MIFSAEYRRRATILNSLYLLVSITGPVSRLRLRPPRSPRLPRSFRPASRVFRNRDSLYRHYPRVPRRAVDGGTIGGLKNPRSLFRDHVLLRLHRFRLHLLAGALRWFQINLFLLGIGGANFAIYTLWLPEQYRTECRASAFGFATSVGDSRDRHYVPDTARALPTSAASGRPVALTSIV